MKSLIIVLSGPSGAGKGTIYNEIRKKRNNVYRYVSCTTRGKRENERDGVDYNFVTVEKFKEMEKQGYFLETIFFHGNYYGTPIPKLEDYEQKDIFFDLNAEGGLKIKERFTQAILIYIMPKNIEELKRRVDGRGIGRIELARNEVELAKMFDWLIINDNIDDSVTAIEDIIRICKNNRMSNKDNLDFIDNFY